jgi:hypothetical protein
MTYQYLVYEYQSVRFNGIPSNLPSASCLAMASALASPTSPVGVSESTAGVEVGTGNPAMRTREYLRNAHLD